MNKVVLTAVVFSSLTVSVSASAAGMARRAVPFNYGARASSAASARVSSNPGYRVSTMENRRKALSYTPISTKQAYAWRRDFGKSNLRKWSSTEGMDTPWRSNSTTDTAHFKASTVAFLDHLNELARRNGVTFVITGGAERGYHASGTYSHENGYKVDISDEGAMWGSKPFKVLHMALAPFKHQITHELENAHYDITIYPYNYRGRYSWGYKY
ncbi:hypothetical protein [uncultured Acidaminococcus sp.]|uniref:hypothetical protein n=1 Tax=uncultured Acidaminococcus sp. TaxID=352152 RepID=UPI0026DBEBFC|nr:hypothetical protein [uncultured Acidaminococcus sp.]